MSTPEHHIELGPIAITPRVESGHLRSLGSVTCHGVPLRNADIRFMPWFDTYQGDLFADFRVNRVLRNGSRTTLDLTAVATMDYPFREKRDSSGDPCFRDVSWDSPPVEAALRICFEPAVDEVDGHTFSGFRYWFEGESPAAKVHRFLDRQTWEVGGRIDGVTVVLRNWLTPPRVVMAKDRAYSTAGFEHEIGCMPGNLWARWTLLPSFDLQRSGHGVLLTHFDRVSLIRTVIEKSVGDDHLRCQDMHCFESAHRFSTNPKTVLFCADQLDDVDLLNLWTRVHDRERDKARAQFGLAPEPPPQISLCHNVWVNLQFDTSYNDTIDLAAALNADNVMIDPIWESGQTLMDELAAVKPSNALGKPSVLDKLCLSNQCAVMDWEVDKMRGGEAGLKRVCDYAASRGINVLSWIGAHLTPSSRWRHGSTNQGMGCGKFGVFAARESGCHPDTGYPGDCWALNLNTPVKDHLIRRVLEIAKATGLKGFLWDSFSNLGWWQLDYSNGTMKPQFAEMADVYTQLANAGLYLMPEAITTFSSHSCLGLYGEDPYRDEDIGYSYDTAIHSPHTKETRQPLDSEILRGKQPVDFLFQCLAHKRAPNLSMSFVPGKERDANAIDSLRTLFTAYRTVRGLMHKRTVLKDGLGVQWESADGHDQVLFTFKPQPNPGNATDVMSGKSTAGQELEPHRVYRFGIPCSA